MGAVHGAEELDDRRPCRRVLAKEQVATIEDAQSPMPEPRHERLRVLEWRDAVMTPRTYERRRLDLIEPIPAIVPAAGIELLALTCRGFCGRSLGAFPPSIDLVGVRRLPRGPEASVGEPQLELESFAPIETFERVDRVRATAGAAG